MAGKTSEENGKKGGRPKGKKSKTTLQKEAVLAEFRKKVMGVSNVLFSSQLRLATGVQYLYKIEKELQVGPKGGKKYISSKPILVTAQIEIENYLAGLITEGDPEDEDDPNATYYYITTEKADNKAIDSMLDRTFGKSVQPLAGDPDNPLTFQITGMKIIKEK